MIQLQFRFDFSDFVRAQRLYAKSSIWRRLSNALFRYVFPAAGAIGLALGVIISIHDGIDGKIFVASAILLSFPLLIHLNWRYCFSRTRSDDGDRNFQLDDDLIRTSTSNSRGEVEWPAIHSYSEDANMFLLYIARAKFFPIPKRACTAEQIEELRALLQRCIKRQ